MLDEIHHNIIHPNALNIFKNKNKFVTIITNMDEFDTGQIFHYEENTRINNFYSKYAINIVI